MSYFTLEQLELLQRLRISGITAEGIFEGFRWLDAIEFEFGAVRLQSAALALLLSQAKTLMPIEENSQKQLLSPTPSRSSGSFTTDSMEVDDFLRHGEDHCIRELRQFIGQYSLRQTTVATLTGVSQPYVSKLINGNHKELSLRCRRHIYAWYLSIRGHPEKLVAMDASAGLQTNDRGELMPQRRERHVFRPVVLRMLEEFFTKCQFPDVQKRKDIATACNRALMIDRKGVAPMPKETVTVQIVTNWFANKRKEKKRERQTMQTGMNFGHAESNLHGGC